ncbi:hypothetical protein RJ639_032827 [Escallonia herrerae]|uniref:Zinc finger PHD-type domain-containing protein n=1 Tax=Escallonia herrerae TaxID=1293975 RepID=A0AA88WXF4_9ASTE|nr:hypothetical protein RJ639_032827 [Escallonia herrerae]
MREALFKCYACGAEDKDLSYLCTTCKFWVHKTCALLESDIQCGSHPHPLTLSYSLPANYVKFGQSCRICGERLEAIYWVYACNSGCRYVAHVKCATRGETENFRNGESQLTKDQEDLDANLISLPGNLVTSFFGGVSLKERDTEPNHISHGHPLILCDVSNNIGSKETDVRLASHRYDPHPLILSYPPFDQHPDEFYREKCQVEIDPNFWLYHCGGCDQSFHTTCLFPRGSSHGIKYWVTAKVDKHPHLLRLVQEEKRKWTCNQCGAFSWFPSALACTECNFYVCIYCIMYRRRVVHWAMKSVCGRRKSLFL